jgi:hypothetical protein
MRQLEGNSERIEALARGVTQEEASWKPNPESWSMLEVVNHLYDEEREDFRVRLNIILHHPNDQWPPIDPQGWVVERKYNQRELAESIENFVKEREASLEWLRGLGEPDWDTQYTSPFGSMKAIDMFGAWVTHDQLHMRQLVELHRRYTEQQAKPFSLAYAGDW